MRKLLIVLLLSLSLAACKKEASAPPATESRVSATRAYERHFGPPPTTDKGSCYAFVIYFPSAKESGKVLPFPFFTFDQASIKRVAVERLMGGMELPSYRGEIAQPFAAGAHLLKLTEEGGVVTVDLSNDFLKSGVDPAAVTRALVLTAGQFGGVKGVRLLSEGKALPYAEGVLEPSPAWALEPSPPRLLAVTAMREKGARGVEEVDAYFDRPVDIGSLTIADKAGAPFAGDTYHSVFDMAAVLKPKDPSLFQEKMPVRVRWKVTDKAGRHAEGDEILPLEVKEH